MLGLFLLLCAGAWGQSAVLISPAASPPGPILTGMAELERVFEAEGWSVSRQMGPAAAASAVALEVVVAVHDPAAAQAPGMEALQNVVPPAPESLAVMLFPRERGHRVYAIGSDAVGAMYAAFELAGQIALGSKDQTLVQRIREVKQQPSLAVRGAQILLHRRALQDRLSWVHSESFWKGFLDTLARSRFNLLDLGGVYDLNSGTYSNLYAYLFPDLVPGEDVPDAQAAARNRATLRLVVNMAHDRGLRVNLQNAFAPPAPAANQTSEAELAASTLQQCLFRLLKEIPNADGIGAVLSQTAQSPAAFVSACQPLAVHPGKPLLVVEPGTGAAAYVSDFLRAYGGRSLLKVDFNGEHLGRPYPITGARTEEWNQKSYRSFFNRPRPYGLVFRIGFNGTHRIFPWGDPEFIRRTLQSSQSFEADGFVLETFSAYGSHSDAFTNNTDSNLSYYEWTFERDWYWYELWGRLAYNLQEGDEHFVRLFENRFGPGNGARMFNALRKASRVVPAAASMAGPGPSRRAFAPELSAPLSLQEMLQAQPLDPFATRTMQEEIEALRTGIPNGKESMRERWKAVAAEADEAVALAQAVGEPLRSGPGTGSLLSERETRAYREWQSWLLDFRALAALAHAWQAQTNAAVGLGLYMLTGDVPSLMIASESVKASQAAWRDTVQFTQAHYRPFARTAASGTGLFHWSSLATPWENDLQVLTKTYNEWNDRTEWKYEEGHLAVHRTVPDRELVVCLSIPPSIETGSLFVRYQNGAGQTGQNKMDPSRIPGVYAAQIPSAVIKDGVLQYYFYGNIAAQMMEIMAPGTSQPFMAAVTSDERPPVADTLEHSVSSARDRVTVHAALSDPSGCFAANLYWKPFASDQLWVKAPMQQSGSEFTAVFPLSPEGAMYAVEAIDNVGNACLLPDASVELPYRVIPPFEKGNTGEVEPEGSQAAPEIRPSENRKRIAD